MDWYMLYRDALLIYIYERILGIRINIREQRIDYMVKPVLQLDWQFSTSFFALLDAQYFNESQVRVMCVEKNHLQ